MCRRMLALAALAAVLPACGGSSDLTAPGGVEFVMYYTGVAAAKQIGRATSSDGVTWTKDAANPVLSTGAAGQWDEENVTDASALLHNGVWYLYYAGESAVGEQIGVATSPDGRTWTRSPANPIVPLGVAGAFDEVQASNPVVIHDGTQFVMWYAAVDASDVELTARATSPDGVAWTKTGVVLNLGAAGSFDEVQVSDPGVVRTNGLHYLYYNAVDTATSPDPEGTRRIALAVSVNGTAWSKLGPVFTPSPTVSAFDALRTSQPEIERVNGVFHLWYGGKSDDDDYAVGTPLPGGPSQGIEIGAIGLATSPDGVVFTRVGNGLSLAPSAAWEGTLTSNPTVVVLAR